MTCMAIVCKQGVGFCFRSLFWDSKCNTFWSSATCENSFCSSASCENSAQDSFPTRVKEQKPTPCLRASVLFLWETVKRLGLLLLFTVFVNFDYTCCQFENGCKWSRVGAKLFRFSEVSISANPPTESCFWVFSSSKKKSPEGERLIFENLYSVSQTFISLPMLKKTNKNNTWNVELCPK